MMYRAAGVATRAVRPGAHRCFRSLPGGDGFSHGRKLGGAVVLGGVSLYACKNGMDETDDNAGELRWLWVDANVDQAGAMEPAALLQQTAQERGYIMHQRFLTALEEASAKSPTGGLSFEEFEKIVDTELAELPGVERAIQELEEQTVFAVLSE